MALICIQFGYRVVHEGTRFKKSIIKLPKGLCFSLVRMTCCVYVNRIITVQNRCSVRENTAELTGGENIKPRNKIMEEDK